MEAFWTHAGIFLGYLGIGVLCLSGVLLSGLSFSGTWLIVSAAWLGTWVGRDGFPGWKTVAAFALVSAVAEVMDTLAGSWGVKRRGGSNWAGIAALLGGLLGMLAGSLIPLPILGPLLGMFAGCFLGAYLVESGRLEKAHAAHIARGAALARVLILCLKLGLTLGMALVLILGMVFA